MPELLAGARFWGHRGRKRWQGYGFGTSMAANVGRGTVMGIWFCTHTQTCRQVLINKTQVFPICLWKRMFAYEQARLHLRAQLPVKA